MAGRQPNQKINDQELKDLVKQGLTGVQIAEHFGCRPSAVNIRIKALNLNVAKEITLRRAPEIVQGEINAIQQLQKINVHANEILDGLMRWQRGEPEALATIEGQANGGKDPRELALKAMCEIRSQLKLQLEIFQTLYDIQAIAAFQQEVLEAIGEASPEIRDKILENLHQRRAILNTVELMPC
ncbi:MAG: hypothetical protein AB9873_18370 [Syntrophobacteraceae bacterium]